MSAWRVVSLAARPQHAATLAAWHHAEWAELYSGQWSLADAVAELTDHARADRLPGTWIALEGEDLLGSVSVIEEDAIELVDYGAPWLASLFVRPQARGRGIGQGLVRAAMQQAQIHGVDELRLFTPEHAEFYRRLGWSHWADTQVAGRVVSVMHWPCSTRAVA